MSTTSGTTDISIKYQRLASEFVKLRSQVSVLKTAVVEEQDKSARLQDEMSEKKATLRKFQSENEGLLFRNCQLVKRVELLQRTLDDANKLQASKGKKKQKEANLRLFVDFTDQPTNIPGTSTGVDRRQLFEQELERQQVVISELESKLSANRDQYEQLTQELRNKIACLEVENTSLHQQLNKANDSPSQESDQIAAHNDILKTNGINEPQFSRHDSKSENRLKQNGCLTDQSSDLFTKQVSDDVSESKQRPSSILAEHTKRLFDEANRSGAEWKGRIAALEHELEIMKKWRDEQTTAADSVDPQTKNTEKSLVAFFRDKVKQLTTDLRFAQGEAAYFKDECNALLTGTKILLETKSDETECSNCLALKESLDDARNTLEFQIRRLYEQLNEQEIHLQEQKDQIHKLNGASSSQTRENSIKQSFRRMVGK